VTPPRTDFWIGIGVVVLGFVLALVAVPEGVVTPKHVRIAVLSPAFWPNILAWLLVVLGAVLAISAARAANGAVARPSARGGLARLALLTVGVVLFCLFATALGLVWASVLLFAGTVLLTGTKHRAAAAAVTLLLPLALYAFFAHVAAVPIPQGHFVTLP
jgi:putative tricarboxylic transport membrane protein